MPPKWPLFNIFRHNGVLTTLKKTDDEAIEKYMERGYVNIAVEQVLRWDMQRSMAVLVADGREIISPITPIHLGSLSQEEAFLDAKERGKLLGTEVQLPYPSCWFEWGIQYPGRELLHCAVIATNNRDKKDGESIIAAVLNPLYTRELKLYQQGKEKTPLAAVALGFTDKVITPNDVRCVSTQFGDMLAKYYLKKEPAFSEFSYKDALTALIELAANKYVLVLQALSMLSCTNIELVEVHPSTRTCRKKREDPNRIVYRELAIKQDTTRAVYPHKSTGEHGVALHTRRGHIADYTKGKGLFGKHKVKIWQPACTVGDPAYGTVLKTYSIDTRKKEK